MTERPTMTEEPILLDERALMRDLADGNLEALATIYDRTVPVLYSLAFRIVGARERACTVIEDLFEEFWRDRARWHTAYSIPIADLITRCRDLALAQSAPEPEPRRPMAAPITDATPPAAELDTAAIKDFGPFISRQAAAEAFAALPEEDRLVLEEAYFRGANAHEIATLLGSPTSDAATLVRTALVRFRDHADQPERLEEPVASEEVA